MRYRKYRKTGIGLLQEWLKMVFTSIGAKKNDKKINNELSRLSEHLLDDLGFDKKGQPLQWVSFLPEKTKFTCLELPGRKAGACLQSKQALRKNCCP
ncbi:MAG TPA: DUF1127 domain-containing protein [Desulfopila sp.]|nr:DUF1127 domain-containing protein [Desulfopila sp.]